MPAITKPMSKKMSLTQTYALAHTARGKLSKEASRGDHDLRLLVGHANLLDGLMVDLADAERAQERWFNDTVAKARKPQTERHVQWADSQPAVDADSDSDSDSDDEMEDAEVTLAAFATAATAHAIDMDSDEEQDDEEQDARLALVRTPSRSSPPELMHESDSESDDDSPPSPPAPAVRFFSGKKEPQPEPEEALYAEGFYLPPRQPIAAY